MSATPEWSKTRKKIISDKRFFFFFFFFFFKSLKETSACRQRPPAKAPSSFETENEPGTFGHPSATDLPLRAPTSDARGRRGGHLHPWGSVRPEFFRKSQKKNLSLPAVARGRKPAPPASGTRCAGSRRFPNSIFSSEKAPVAAPRPHFRFFYPTPCSVTPNR